MPRKRYDQEPIVSSMTIFLEQQQQDFWFFKLAFDGFRRGANDVHVAVYKITEAGPFQNWLWADKLIDGSTINLQCRPAILFDDEWKVLNYPIKKIEVQENLPIVAAVLP